MKLIRYLQEIKLLKSENIKQPNGVYKKSFSEVAKYKVMKKNLDDQVSATVYGANIVKMLSISTALGDLEEYLIPKVENTEDNISLYFIELDGTRYKINSVNEYNVTIERV